MTGYPSDQGNPAGATPVYFGGALPDNITTSVYTQVKTGAGVFYGASVNTGGTTSTIAFYDGDSATVTITIAAPGVISWPAHGLVIGNAVKLQTTGALPTGLTAGTTVYVSSVGFGPNAFSVADTQAHAIAGTNTITTTGTQSGVQTAWDVTTPLGSFATTAAGPISIPAIGIQYVVGLIAVTADGGGAANVTVLYR